VIEALTVRSRYLLTSSSLFKKEKKKERKLKVGGGEGDEDIDKKTIKKWFWNQFLKQGKKREELIGTNY